MAKVWIWMCPRCAWRGKPRRGEVVETSTSEFPFCARCRSYGPWNPTDWRWIPVRAQLIFEEPCNCGEIVMHNTGGNYHYSRWQIA
jgi:hypothetical protein